MDTGKDSQLQYNIQQKHTWQKQCCESDWSTAGDRIPASLTKILGTDKTLQANGLKQEAKLCLDTNKIIEKAQALATSICESLLNYGDVVVLILKSLHEHTKMAANALCSHV